MSDEPTPLHRGALRSASPSIHDSMPRVLVSTRADGEPWVQLLHGAGNVPSGVALGPAAARDLARQLVAGAAAVERAGWHRGRCDECNEAIREQQGRCWLCSAEDVRRRRASFHVVECDEGATDDADR